MIRTKDLWEIYLPSCTLPLIRLFGYTLAFGLTVFASPSSVSLSSSSNSSIYGQPVTLTASVTSGATGKVTFYEGANVLGIASISGSQAALTTIGLPAGNTLLRAYYWGDATFVPSSSPGVAQTVSAVSSLGFNKPIDALVGQAPAQLATGDMNRDGKLDLIFLGNDGAVIILLAKGDGTFQTPVGYHPGFSSGSIAIGDFNSDGILDIAVGSGSNSIRLLFGNGDGTLQAQVSSISTTQTATKVLAADFNGDGRLDLVAAGGSYISVLPGNGDGTFQTAIVSPAQSSVVAIGVGDFNGDGKPDLAVSLYYNFYIWSGKGDGSFQQLSASYAFGYDYAHTIAVGDFNADGKLDLAVGSTSVFVLLGNGDGSFQAPAGYAAGASPFQVMPGDFNGDGKIDLAALNYSYYSSGSLNVLIGDGDGSFQAPMVYSTQLSPALLASGDFNGDGKTDVVTSALTASTSVNIFLGGAVPDLAVVISHGNGLTRGQVGASYTVTVSNIGAIASSGAVGVVITLPAGLTVTSVGGNGWTCSMADPGCSRSDSVAAGAGYPPITVTVNVSASLTSNVTTTATVAGGSDTNLSNNAVADTTFPRFINATALNSSPNPSTLGQTVTLTATVSSGATGRVAFFDGAVPLSSASINNSQATLTTTVLAAGPHSLRAQYSGDSNYGPSSAARSHTVNAATTNGLQPATTYSLSRSAIIVTLGDFNGDGKPDLATSDSSGISILLGKGDGTFQPGWSSTTSLTISTAILAADFTNDGILDLAFSGTNGICVLAGKGDATFQPAVCNAKLNYVSLTVADFNSDGNLDLVGLANGLPYVLAGNGDGTFQPPASASPGTVAYSFMAVSDFNRDGKLDLLLARGSYDIDINVLLGKGDGTFLPALSTTAPNIYYADSFTVGDFNGDGKPDVAFIYWVAAAVLLGNGDGTFQAPITSQLGYVPGYSATAGDFDGDGKLDIAYNGYYSSQAVIALGNGDGTLQRGVVAPTEGYSSGSWPVIVSADFNGDGRPDFAVGGNKLKVYPGGLFLNLLVTSSHTGNFVVGQTGATYQITVTNPLFTGTSGTITVNDSLPGGFVATSITGTGWTCTLTSLTCTRSDSLTANSSYPPITITVNVLNGLNAGTVNNTAYVSWGSTQYPATDSTVVVLPVTAVLNVSPNVSTLGQVVTLTASVSAGATGKMTFLDGGQFLGTVALSGTQATLSTRSLPAGVHSLRVVYGGDLTHAPGTSPGVNTTVNAALASGLATAATYAVSAGPIYVTGGDFNTDGKTDLAVANFGSNTVSILLGKGDGAFQAKTDYPVGTGPVWIAAGDYNGDGKTDLAVLNNGSANVSVLLGKGDGTFQAGVNYATGSNLTSIATADFDGDGILDLAVANNYAVSILTGKGDGTFRAPTDVSSYYSTAPLTVGDFNGDGKADLVNGSVLLGNGNATFSQSYLGSITALGAGDLNGDGRMDVVTVTSGSACVLTGKGDGTFLSPQSCYSSAASPSSVALADVNGDGNLDAVITDRDANKIYVMLGNGNNGSLQPAVAYSVDTSPRSIAAGDFNGDGRTDLVTANYTGNSISVLLGILTPVLKLTVAHPSNFYLSQTGAAYTITVSNTGPGPTTGTISVSNTLPTGLSATSISGQGWACTLASLNCTRSDALAEGDSFPAITLTVNVASNASASVTNQVSVSGGNTVGAYATDITSIESGPAPDLTIMETHAGYFTQGQTGVVYTITVSNSGTATTNGTVTVTPTLPAGLTASAIAGTGWSCTQPLGPCTRSIALAASASYPPILVTVNVASNAPYQLTTTATVSGGGETNTTNDTATDVTAIVGTATSVFSPSAVPGTPWHSDSPVTLGMKFTSEINGRITGLRFYKGPGNRGSHTAMLYSYPSGTLLSQSSFDSESASGWQQVNFFSPVAITAGTTYVAAYFSTSGFAYDAGYFNNTGVDNSPLHALKKGANGPNSVYAYGGSPQYPANDGGGANYWVDVVFSSGSLIPTPDLTVTGTNAGNFTLGQAGSYTITVSNIGTAATSGTVTLTEVLPSGLTGIAISGTGWSCTQPSGPCSRSDTLSANASYPAIALSVNVASNAASQVTNSVTVSGGGESNTANDATTIQSAVLPSTATFIFNTSLVPANPWHSDSAVTLGMKFTSDISGTIMGVRFYKGQGNNGTHTGMLYSYPAGTLLAQATFSSETVSGWQQATFSSPVAITAGATYIVAYFSTSGFAYNPGYFLNAGVDNSPLHALKYGVSGVNSVYAYGPSPQYPANDGGGANYWVDVMFSSGSSASAPDLAITTTHAGNFTQGQTGTYTIAVSNIGAAPSYGGITTVTVSLPTGLTATGISGTGWNCAQPSGFCSRFDTLPANASYPALTLSVNVASNAPSQVTNSVTVGGVGEINLANNTANDVTVIQASGSSSTAVSIFNPSILPATAWHSDSSVTLGMKFTSDISGTITGLRFYKGLGNNGTHTGLLYSYPGGALLSQATFSNETISGWQQVTFSSPVAITAGATYVAAFYSSSGFAYNPGYFLTAGVDNSTLHALKNGISGPNSVYAYGPFPQYPANDGGGANYWVDVVFSSSSSTSSTPDLTVTMTHAGSFRQGQTGTYTVTVRNSGTAATTGTVTVTHVLLEGLSATGISGTGWSCVQPSGPCARSDSLAANASYPVITLNVAVALNAPSQVTAFATATGGGETNTTNDSASDVTAVPGAAASIFSPFAIPETPWHSDSPVTLGLKFTSDVGGTITGLKFCKGPGNNGTHIGMLYSYPSGILLAQATFSGETASGWQQVTLSSPVAITAGATYIAAFFSTSGFAYTPGYFGSAGVDNAPLHALRYGISGPNSVYAYGASPQYPANDGGGANYWVDVLFTP